MPPTGFEPVASEGRPCGSNSVRLGSSPLAPAAGASVCTVGLRPGFWPAGPVHRVYSQALATCGSTHATRQFRTIGGTSTKEALCTDDSSRSRASTRRTAKRSWGSSGRGSFRDSKRSMGLRASSRSSMKRSTAPGTSCSARRRKQRRRRSASSGRFAKRPLRGMGGTVRSADLFEAALVEVLAGVHA